MALRLDSLQKPLRRLRKSLKRFPKDPLAEEVHQLRTQARRMEAMAAALLFEQGGQPRHLLKTVGALRRAAGEVRDMDVLIANARGLAEADLRNDDRGCLESLVGRLRAIRTQSASELHETVTERRKDARRDLKRYSRQVERIFEGRKLDSKLGASSKTAESSSPVDPATAALDFASELSRWPRLQADNIHPFRIKVKTLRYVVELAEEADNEFVRALDEVKDRIGEWHDWHELRRIARKILDHPGECRVRKQIEKIEKQKLKQALAAANAMRQRYLNADTAAPMGKKPPSSDHLHGQAASNGAKLAG
jgi:CHAD domain-containing protein